MSARLDSTPCPSKAPAIMSGGTGLLLLAMLSLIIASFWTLGLKWGDFLSIDAFKSMGRFVAEFFPMETDSKFLGKVGWGTVETLAMSLMGTVLAAVAGLALAIPASKLHSSDKGLMRTPTRWVLNALRSIPELVWAALLLISAGLGPFAGTLALAFHTTGVLGRLFAESIENAPQEPADALRTQGIGNLRVFYFTTLPQVIPQLMSYTLYRWENNIRAAAILGVVGAGGLGQLLSFHMGLFQMGKTATILAAMLLLVAIVDSMSYHLRSRMTR